MVTAKSVAFDFGLDVSPPVADTSTGGSDTNDDGDQNHGQHHSVLDSGRRIFVQEKAA